MQISSKVQMYALSKKGRFGNTLRMWNNLNDIPTDFHGMVGIRHTDRSGGKLARQANMPVIDLPLYICLHRLGHMPAGSLVIQEGAPDERLICQGEVMRGLHGLDVRLSFKKCKMREAMEGETMRLTGLIAKMVLKAVMYPSSYDDLMELLEIYDSQDIQGPPNRDTVIEFGAYEMPLGQCGRRNTVMWECRAY